MCQKKKLYNKVCVVCGKAFKHHHPIAKYCSWDCKQIMNKKRYREKPLAPSWNSIVEFIKERDNYKCVECKSDKKLCVHHKKFLCNGGTNNPNNLVTLCLKCHASKHKIKIKVNNL